MSRRNTDAITIHSILDWIEDNLESPLSLEKVSERSGYSKWHLQRMFKKETIWLRVATNSDPNLQKLL